MLRRRFSEDKYKHPQWMLPLHRKGRVTKELGHVASSAVDHVGKLAKYTAQVYNNSMIVRVIFSSKASKQMRRAPSYITDKLLNWAREVEIFGLEAVRKHKGYHDEPLKGQRAEERSIRLNRQWRAIYCEKTNSSKLIYILEVTPHDYEK
jgi:proteic killer suppression protein